MDSHLYWHFSIIPSGACWIVRPDRLSWSRRRPIIRCFKAWHVAVNTLSLGLWGKRYQRRGLPGVGWFAVVEAHGSGALHLHAVVVGIPLDRERRTVRALVDHWDTRFGRCECKRVRSNRAIGQYLVKGLPYFADWDCARNMSQFALKSACSESVSSNAGQ